MISFYNRFNSIVVLMLLGSIAVSGEFYPTGGYQGGGYGSGGDKTLDVEVLNLKVYLGGCYATDSLLPGLNVLGILPFGQPYNSDPAADWYYTGSESVDSIPTNRVVDWILVELRETAGGSSTANRDSVIGTRAGFIITDGTITDLDGASELRFKYLKATENFYAVVRHRNHLPVMNATTLVLVDEVRSWNFTDNPDKYYHESGYTNNEPSVNLGSGKYGLWPGNAKPDKVVKFNGNNNDREEILNLVGPLTPSKVVEGYYPEDLDLNGKVSYMGKNNDKVSIYLFLENNTLDSLKTHIPE